MTTEELYDKLKLIQKMKCETQNLELKSAEQGCPKRLYDSLLLEPGGIDHLESDRNSQFELNRNSQCTLAN